MHQGWIPQSLPCHIALFCHRKGTNSFPKARGALTALIGSAVTHHYALGAKQGSSCCALKISESFFTAIRCQIALGRAWPILLLILGWWRTSSVDCRSVLSSTQTGCVMLRELAAWEALQQHDFSPLFARTERFLGFFITGSTMGLFFLTTPLADLFYTCLGMWNAILQSSFTIPKPFPFQPWLRAAKLAPKGT